MEQILAVLGVLALLGLGVWALRRKGLAQFAGGKIGRGATRQLQAVERLALTPQHSLHLVRMSDRALLVAVSPSGCSLIDNSEWKAIEDPKALELER